jgi:hypothetical protein
VQKQQICLSFFRNSVNRIFHFALERVSIDSCENYVVPGGVQRNCIFWMLILRPNSCSVDYSQEMFQCSLAVPECKIFFPTLVRPIIFTTSKICHRQQSSVTVNLDCEQSLRRRKGGIADKKRNTPTFRTAP